MYYPYIVPPFLAFLSAIVETGMSKNIKKIVYVLLSFSSILIYCFVYINGSDWINYHKFYNDISWNNLFEESKMRGFEIGFGILMMTLKSLGLNFMLSLISMKIFSFVVISNFFYSYSVSEYAKGYAKNVFLLLFVFYLTSCMYLYVETIIRFSIALAIVVKSYKYIFKRCFLKFFLLVVLASLFHRTSIIIFPLYFIKKINFSNIKLFLLAFLVVTFFSPKMLLIIFQFLFGSNKSIFLVKIIAYVEVVNKLKQTNPLAIGNIVYYCFFVLILFMRRKIEENNLIGKQLFAFTMVYFFVYFVTIFMGPIGRLRLLYMCFFVIILSEGISYTYSGRTYVFLISMLYFCFGFYISISSTWCFKNYTNYISSLLDGGGNLSLEEKIRIYDSWDGYDSMKNNKKK